MTKPPESLSKKAVPLPVKSPRPKVVSTDFSPCKFDGCQGNSKASGAARGYCRAHYQQVRRQGEEALHPVAIRTGKERVVTNVSLHAWDSVIQYALENGLTEHAAAAAIIESNVDQYLKKGLPDRVPVPRGDSSNVVQTQVSIETLVKLTNLGRLAGGRSRGYATQQVLERFGLTTKFKSRHDNCYACQAR